MNTNPVTEPSVPEPSVPEPSAPDPSAPEPAEGPSLAGSLGAGAGSLRDSFSFTALDAKARLQILRAAKSVAIVGASSNPSRSSYFVGTYLQQSSDYRVYFVNPHADTILGQKAYPDLASLPEVPDIVDVFRKSSDIPAVIDDVLAVGAPTIWVQLGIWNQDAAIYAQSKGLTVVMDRCIKIEHARFHGGLHLLGFDTGQITSRKTIR